MYNRTYDSQRYSLKQIDKSNVDQPPVVVRIGNQSSKAEMIGAVPLSELLKPLGVPLAAILAEDVRAELPWLVLKRLPGTDLADVIAGLSDEQLYVSVLLLDLMAEHGLQRQ